MGHFHIGAGGYCQHDLQERIAAPGYLPCISPVSPLYLAYISPVSPLYLLQDRIAGPTGYWCAMGRVRVRGRGRGRTLPYPSPYPSPYPYPYPYPCPYPGVQWPRRAANAGTVRPTWARGARRRTCRPAARALTLTLTLKR